MHVNLAKRYVIISAKNREPMLKKLFVLLSFTLLVNCASNVPKSSLFDILEQEQCETDSFKGTGIADAEMEAIGIARSIIASRIQASLEVHSELTREVIEQKASLHFKKDIIQTYILKNANNVEIKFRKQEGQKIGVVACMTKANAAKDFVEQQRLIADSLEMVSSAMLNTKHPKHKNEDWHKTQTYYNTIVAVQNLLDTWGFAKTDYFNKANEIYAKTKDYYKSYCKDMKIFWQDAGNECSETVFAMLSKEIKMEKSRCFGGLKLNFNCPEKCAGSALGTECSFNPSLAIESCSGEKYSMLKIQEPVTGIDAHNKTQAKENLIENLSKADFFKEWAEEITELVPQCTE